MTSEKILVIKLGALGDIILATEAFQAIRAKHPAAHISLLTRPPFVSFTSDMPWFDEIISDPKPKFHQVGKWLRFRRQLRNHGFSRVYDLQTNDRTGFYFKLLAPNPPEWCGTVRGCSHFRHDHRRDPVPAAERLLRFLESVGVPNAGPPDLSWLTASVDSLDLPTRYVVLIPGCAPQHPHKRWPATYYAEVAHFLRQHSIDAVAVGTPVDQSVIREICSHAPFVIDLSGKTSIAQLAEVARRSQGVIGNDTGPTHIAAIVGAPTLVVMSGRTDPVRMLPRGPNVGWVRNEKLEDLSVREVISAVKLRSGSLSK